MARKYVANWRIEGIAKKPLEAGDKIDLEDEVAAELVKAGALSLARTKPADATKTEDGQGGGEGGEGGQGGDAPTA